MFLKLRSEGKQDTRCDLSWGSLALLSEGFLKSSKGKDPTLPSTLNKRAF